MRLIKKLLELSQKESLQKFFHGATDVGKARSANEDYYVINKEKNLYIVADGMGGHNAGEVASKKASHMADSFLTPELLKGIQGNNRLIRQTIIDSLLFAHSRVLEMADRNPNYEGMGCTIVAALIIENHLHLCHVGDARAYVYHKDNLVLLTRDHSYVMELVQKGKLTMEEARVSPMKNKLHQAIGASRSINPDYKNYILKGGDKILLCSDGLWDMMSDDQIYTVLRQDKSAKKLCETLIKMANNAGGHDNITAVVIEHQAQEASFQSDQSEDFDVPEKTGEYSFAFDKLPSKSE